MRWVDSRCPSGVCEQPGGEPPRSRAADAIRRIGPSVARGRAGSARRGSTRRGRECARFRLHFMNGRRRCGHAVHITRVRCGRRRHLCARYRRGRSSFPQRPRARSSMSRHRRCSSDRSVCRQVSTRTRLCIFTNSYTFYANELCTIAVVTFYLLWEVYYTIFVLVLVGIPVKCTYVSIIIATNVFIDQVHWIYKIRRNLYNGNVNFCTAIRKLFAYKGWTPTFLFRVGKIWISNLETRMCTVYL